MSDTPRKDALVEKQAKECLDVGPDFWTRGLALRHLEEAVDLAGELERELQIVRDLQEERDLYRRRADQFESALAAGWKLVPGEPTVGMLRAMGCTAPLGKLALSPEYKMLRAALTAAGREERNYVCY